MRPRSFSAIVSPPTKTPENADHCKPVKNPVFRMEAQLGYDGRMLRITATGNSTPNDDVNDEIPAEMEAFNADGKRLR